MTGCQPSAVGTQSPLRASLASCRCVLQRSRSLGAAAQSRRSTRKSCLLRRFGAERPPWLVVWRIAVFRAVLAALAAHRVLRVRGVDRCAAAYAAWDFTVDAVENELRCLSAVLYDVHVKRLVMDKEDQGRAATRSFLWWCTGHGSRGTPTIKARWPEWPGGERQRARRPAQRRPVDGAVRIGRPASYGGGYPPVNVETAERSAAVLH
jgi:hypothetical protein